MEVVHNRFRRVCACMPDIVVRGILHILTAACSASARGGFLLFGRGNIAIDPDTSSSRCLKLAPYFIFNRYTRLCIDVGV